MPSAGLCSGSNIVALRFRWFYVAWPISAENAAFGLTDCFYTQ